MSEKKFGERKLLGANTFFEALKVEKEKEGFEYAGEEKLVGSGLKGESIQEVIIQRMKDIEKKYKKRKNVKEVKLMRNLKDENLVWVFIKTK